MAELPDLTVFANTLSRKFKGELLDKIEVTESRKLNVAAERLKTSLEGRELSKVIRDGKTLQFHFSDNQVLGLHLMLRGALVELENKDKPRFQIMAFRFKNGKGFAVTDMQKQAAATLNPEKNMVPDALSLEKEYFTALLAKKRTSVKKLLMDQSALRGIGNSYADEILYNAGVSPLSSANAIPLEFAAKIHESMRTILENAIIKIGDANGDELKGELKDFMEIHNPVLKATAKGELIKTEKISGRTTYFTDSQKLF